MLTARAALTSCFAAAVFMMFGDSGRGAVTWQGTTDDNWSTTTNWNPNGSPAGQDILFDNTDAQGTAGLVNNIVDTSVGITSLGYLNYNSGGNKYHTTQIPAGQTLTVNGGVTIGPNVAATNTTTRVDITGGGSLVVNAPSGRFQVAGSTQDGYGNTATLDMSALGAFNAALNVLRIGDNTTGCCTTASSTMVLANTNSITATSIELWTGHTGVQTLRLGSGSNTLYANSIVVGLGTGRADGVLQFNGPSGSLTVRDKTGSGRANLYVVSGLWSDSGTSGTLTGTVDLTSHQADLLLNMLSVGVRTSGYNVGGSGANGTFSFDQGTLDATTVQVGRKSGSTGTATINGTLNLGGGTVTIGSGGIAMATNTTTVDGAVNAAVNITGGTVTLGGDIAKGGGLNTTATLTLNGASAVLNMQGRNITGMDAFTYQNGTLKNLGTVNTGIALAGTGSRVFHQDAAYGGEIQGTISGTGIGLTKTGDGKLILSGTNTYTGPTDVNAGVLQFNSPAAIAGSGRNVSVAFGATAAFGPSFGDIQSTLTGRIANTSAGTVALTANSSENLDFSAAGADLTAASLGAVGTATYSGTLVPNGATYRLGGGGGTLTVSSALSGANSLVVHGSGSGGTVVLSATNSYTGTTTVNPGVLAISAANQLGSGGIILNGGTLRTTGSTAITVNRPITLTANSILDTQNSGNTYYSGVISDGAGTFGFTKIGSANLILGGNNTYDGETILTGGTTYINNNNALGTTVGGTTVTGTLTLESNGMVVNEPLTLNGWLRTYPTTGGSTYAGSVTLAGNSTFSAKYAGTTFHVSGTISGNYGLTINTEPGMVRLSGTNTYTGTTSIRQSTLLIGANAPSGAPGALGNATSAVNVGMSGTPSAENLALLTDGAFTVGRDIVVGNQNATGTTTLGGRQTTGASTFSGAITLNRNVMLTSANTDANGVTFSGPISGAAYGITKIGPGMVILSGTNSYGGGTTISEGTLRFLTDASLGAADTGITLGGGTLDYGGTTDYYALSRPITLTADSSIKTSSGRSLRITGKISDGAGAFGYTMTGGYVYLANGANDYDGTTVVTGGVLYAQANGVLGSTAGPTTVGSAGILTVDTNYTTPETLNLNGGVLRTSMGGGATATWTGNVVLGADSVIRAKVYNGQGTLVVAGPISGNYGVRVGDGEAGIVKFTATSSYTGPTTVRTGNLIVDGSIASSSGVLVEAPATLQGHGVVPAVSGSGLVSPGNSAGILTAASVDPAGGLDFAFQFGALGSPDYAHPANSVNDVLRLTSMSAPFTNPMQAGNQVNVYFNVASLDAASVFRGGFYADLGQDFSGQIGGATFNYFVALDGHGPVVFEGIGYYPLADTGLVPGFSVSSVLETADFGAGPVQGFVMQFGATPEPSTFALAGLGLLGVGLIARRRGNRTRQS